MILDKAEVIEVEEGMKLIVDVKDKDLPIIMVGTSS